MSIVIQKRRINGRHYDIVECHRVRYGKKETPIEQREYQLFPGSPVGCIDELESFISNMGRVDGILLYDSISNCTLFKPVGGKIVDLGIECKN